jgi:hypothetical protein
MGMETRALLTVGKLYHCPTHPSEILKNISLNTVYKMTTPNGILMVKHVLEIHSVE